MGALLLRVVVVLPLAAALLAGYLGQRQPKRALRTAIGAALLLNLTVSFALVDVELQLPVGRTLVLSPVAQLGVQLLALAMLGLVLSLDQARPAALASWLPIAWASLAGLTLALLVTSLPLALLAFVGAALLWALGLPPDERSDAPNAVLRYAALLSLAMPLLLTAFRLAESQTGATLQVDRTVLLLAVPGFGLLLGLIPLHAWTLTLAAGTPRVMLFGVLSVVQTAGFVLLLRTLETYPWIAEAASGALVLGGALSAAVGGWLALSARRDDPDDWLVYAAVANSGMILAGLGTQSRAAAVGVVLLLLARVLAMLVLVLAPSVSRQLGHMAEAGGTLTLAGAPGLAGFPGLWLVLRNVHATGHPIAAGALLAGSGLLMATAVRQWRRTPAGAAPPPASPTGDEPDSSDATMAGGWSGASVRPPLLALLVLLIALGLLPELVAPAFTDALRGMFFPAP